MPKRTHRPPPPRSGFDQPSPSWIPPCLPTLVTKPPEGEKWSHEIKWDGYRVSAYLDGGKVSVRTRNGHDWASRFPEITEAMATLPSHNAVIDGEAVVLDEEGKSSFSALQAALGTSGRGPGMRMAGEALPYAFDLLFLDGHDLRDWSLSDRRDALLGTIGKASPVLRFSQVWEATGAELFAAADANGLEGIASKRLDLPYRSGRSESWLKTKCVRDGTFAVVGYQPSASRS